MNRILVPIDFGVHSKEIFHYALECAKKMKSRVILFNAVHIPHTERSRIVEYQKSLETLAEISRRKLKSFLKENFSPGFSDIAVDIVVKKKKPGSSIVNYARLNNVSFIIMGMTNKNNWEDLLFGSVSKFVLNKAECPVLILPPQLSFKPFDKILYLIHYGYSNLKNLKVLKNWKTAWDAAIYGVFTAEKGPEEKELEEVREKGRQLFSDLIPTNQLDIIKGDNHFREAFLNYMEQHQISLLALENQDRTLKKLMHEKKATNIARDLRLPILFLRRK